MIRCKVCHRELTDPAHIAAGVGPVCAAKAARFGIAASQAKGTDERERAAVEKKLAKATRMIAFRRANLDEVEETLARVRSNPNADPAKIARGERLRRILCRGLTRLARIRADLEKQLRSAAKRAA